MARGQVDDSLNQKGGKSKADGKEKAVWNGKGYVIKKAKKKSNVVWTIPDDLVAFLVNLPRTIQAKRHHKMPWILHRLWKLMALKSVADAEDNRLGYSLQPFTEFVIEAHLERSKLRTGDVPNIYMLLMS